MRISIFDLREANSQVPPVPTENGATADFSPPSGALILAVGGFIMIPILILALLFAAVLTSITFAAGRVEHDKALTSAQREELRDYLLLVGRDWSGFAKHINRTVA